MPFESAYFTIERLGGRHDLKEIKRELGTLHGVNSVSVNTQNGAVAVDYDSSGTSYDTIENRLNKMGYEIVADDSEIQFR